MVALTFARALIYNCHKCYWTLFAGYNNDVYRRRINYCIIVLEFSIWFFAFVSHSLGLLIWIHFFRHRVCLFCILVVTTSFLRYLFMVISPSFVFTFYVCVYVCCVIFFLYKIITGKRHSCTNDTKGSARVVLQAPSVMNGS